MVEVSFQVDPACILPRIDRYTAFRNIFCATVADMGPEVSLLREDMLQLYCGVPFHQPGMPEGTVRLIARIGVARLGFRDVVEIRMGMGLQPVLLYLFGI